MEGICAEMFKLLGFLSMEMFITVLTPYSYAYRQTVN